jgi:lysozyme
MKNLKQAVKLALPLIKKSEGYFTQVPGGVTAYLDPVGIPTIGYGTTYYIATGSGKVKMGDKLTHKQATAELEAHIAEKAKGVGRYIKKDLQPAQLASIISIAYNAGPGALAYKSSVTGLSIASAINTGKSTKVVSDTIKSIATTAQGKKLRGLVNRRKEEASLFESAKTLIVNNPKSSALLALVLVFLIYKNFTTWQQ